MKVGDDDGKKYRRQFLRRDPVGEKFDRYGWIIMLLVMVYFSGHLVYAYFTL